MSDELEARMWDEGSSRFEQAGRGVYFESTFASSEHLDRAPLLSEETFADVPVVPSEDEEHCHWRSTSEPPSAIPKLLTALVLCAFFMICEFIGGYLAGSLSVMCDAAHMLSDCGGFALALLAFHCAKRRPDTLLSYGYKRAEVLGAMVSVLLIWILTGVFVYMAVVRLHTGDYAALEPDLMMLVSGAGVAFNVLLALVLNGCAKDIAHHHSHGGAPCSSHKHANGDYRLDINSAETTIVAASTPPAKPSSKNINLRAALIHVIGDLIQSCGVLIASILIKFYPSAKIVDPICTFVFSVVVLLTSARVVRDALAMLMQAVPNNFSYREVLSRLSSIAGVRHVHSLHVWSLSTHHIVLTAHVAVDEMTDPEPVLVACQRVCRSLGVQSATLQVERYSAASRACVECRAQPALQP